MKLVLNIIIIITLIGCQSSKLPSETYSQYNYHKSYLFENNALKIELENPLKSPLRIWIQSSDEGLQSRFNETNPIELIP